MDYKSTYQKLIETRKVLTRKKSLGVYENHHILPKSLGGCNDKDNLVLLTPKEHFIAHLLLFKMHEGSNKAKMAYALFKMCSKNKNQKRSVTSRQYEYAKKQMSLVCRGENNPIFGTNPFTSEQIEEIRKRQSGATNSMHGKKPWNYGLKTGNLSEEHKEKISIGNTGKRKTDETKRKISAAHAGKKKTDAHRKKLSLANTGKKLSDEARRKISEKNKERKTETFVCPHCLISGKSSAMFRWHFDKCKSKN
jgi:hypothetical protein